MNYATIDRFQTHIRKGSYPSIPAYFFSSTWYTFNLVREIWRLNLVTLALFYMKVSLRNLSYLTIRTRNNLLTNHSSVRRHERILWKRVASFFFNMIGSRTSSFTSFCLRQTLFLNYLFRCNKFSCITSEWRLLIFVKITYNWNRNIIWMTQENPLCLLLIVDSQWMTYLREFISLYIFQKHFLFRTHHISSKSIELWSAFSDVIRVEDDGLDSE